MRPVRVEMMGFSTFRDRTVVDFSDVDLAAIWGPTGSGKSSIVDAITFALYGSVARYDDDRLVAPIINQTSAEARVCLDFELDGLEYTAVRIVRRTKTGATTKESRLQQGDRILAGMASEMAAAVEQLIGMNFGQFTKTVVLPQGDFADFLRDGPSDRQRLLRRLLEFEVYSRMGEEARRRWSSAQSRIEALSEQAEQIGEVTEDHLGQLTLAIENLAATRKQVAEFLKVIDSLTTEIDVLSNNDATIQGQSARLGAIEVPEEVASLGVQMREARERLGTQLSALKSARSNLKEADAAVKAGPDKVLCSRLLEARAELADLADSAEALVLAVDKATAAFQTASAAANHARKELQEVDEVLLKARSTAGAEGLIASLTIGSRCPVCRQVVEAIPDHDVRKDLKAAEKEQASCRKRASSRDELLLKAHEKLADIKAAKKSADGRIGELTKQLSSAPTTAELQTQLEIAASLEHTRTEASDQIANAESDVESAQSLVESLESVERNLRTDFGALRDSVMDMEPPRPNGEGLHDDWSDLTDWAAAKKKEVDKALQGVRKRSTKLLSERMRAIETVEEICRPFTADDAQAPIGEVLAEAETRLSAELEQGRQRQKALGQIHTQILDATEERDVTGEMGRLLKVDAFERWLMEEAVVDLLDRATERLIQLSGGQYSFVSDDMVFRIRDHRSADEVRDARTLSGGETFLASLSLALALGESIGELAPRGSPQFESMFLDEGFGALDAETLDTVASAIEELSASGRMVTIVTHIRELADRLPIRFDVVKGPTTSTVERVEV